MDSPTGRIASVLISAILFTLLFYDQDLGINLLLFELSVIGLLLLHKRFSFKTEVMVTLLGTVITALMVVIHNSMISVLVNIFSMFMMVSTILLPNARSLVFSGVLGAIHTVMAQIEMVSQFSKIGSDNSLFGIFMKWARIIVIPIVIVIIFVSIYSAANPVFEEMVSGITDVFDSILRFITERIEVGLFWFFFLGVIISDFLIQKTTESSVAKRALAATDQLNRKRKKQYFKTLDLGLKREFRSGMLLLIALNSLLLLINCIDIYWVWFNFEWSGDYLKQFVHEGTYLLIISIIISIAISMYVFRGNQNFYTANSWLKRLTILWLAQNAVLAVSVGIRNLHYIQYYALAHKRIGVMFFLLATIIGLAIVIIKIRERKTLHFVLRKNALSAFCILVIITLVNWDVVIAKYNFKHADRSFVHFNFMVILSNAALPYIDKDYNTLYEIELANERFPSDVDYMRIEQYASLIEDRKERFKEDFEQRHWLSWNLAYQRSYDQLFKE